VESNPSLRLLIVDDEPDLREIIDGYAKQVGFTTVQASNGKEALDQMKHDPCDVVISDLMMPEMTGMDLLKGVRQLKLDVPFLILTAYSSQELVLDALKLGAFDYLEKPFGPQELQKILQEAMRISEKSKKTANMDSNTQNNPGNSLEGESVDGFFVAEIVNQISYVESLQRGLESSDNKIWKLGVIFRTMQSIAKVIDALACDELVKATECFKNIYAQLRAYPAKLNAQNSSVLLDSLDRLNEGLKIFVQDGDLREVSNIFFKIQEELVQNFPETIS
jgi:CheY-like chemotaxis protein